MTDLNLLRNLAAFTCACCDSLTKRAFLPALIVSLNLLLTGHAPAQTFTTLHSFGATPTDGSIPSSGLVLSANTLYGTTAYGGSSSNGAVFSVHSDGSGYTNLYNFTAAANTNSSGVYTNGDGGYPGSANYVGGGYLVLSGNTLYGTAYRGGSSGNGTVFSVHTDGTSFTNLHSFTATPVTFPFINSDGDHPNEGLILSNNILYGTAQNGGSGGYGTVFAINTDGTGFKNLHSFAAPAIYNPFFSYVTNSDGISPNEGLVLAGNALYGTAAGGGAGGVGTIFAVNTAGTGFTNLYSFTGISSPVFTNSDGAEPVCGLVLSGNALYGTTSYGGAYDIEQASYVGANGTVFKINTDGTGFVNLHNFSEADTNDINTDGIGPSASLIISGSILYGTAYFGGIFGSGTVFALNTNGTRFTTLHNLAAISNFTNSDGYYPQAVLILSGNTLYGTAYRGGSSGNGTVFSLTLPAPPQLTITPFAANVILSWPTNSNGFPFTLQSTTNLVSPEVWTTVSPTPVVVSRQNTVTNPISDPQKFYRLSQ